MSLFILNFYSNTLLDIKPAYDDTHLRGVMVWLLAIGLKVWGSNLAEAMDF
jgi:hypothetical protein